MSELVERTTEIVSAFVSQNTIPVAALSDLIRSVYRTLETMGQPQEQEVEAPAAKATPSQIRKSISDAGLISFEDGKTYKTLKRHLSTRGMTLQDYKAKWGLPNDYPSTSPAYSAARSAMAKSIGLGRKTGEKAPIKAKAPSGPRGRPKNAPTAAE